MSHFTVLVIGNDVDKALAPFHEFECTGADDQYVQDIDETADTLQRYQNGATARVRNNATGALYPTYDDQFFHFLPDDKSAEILALPHHQRPDGTYVRDGKVCTYELPEGYEEVKVPYTEIMSFLDYVKRDTDDNCVVEFGKKPDLKEHHKYGYVLLNESGEVEKVIRRTNPNAKWDWYQIGGRWSGFFKKKPEAIGLLGDRSWTNAGEEIPEDRADQITKVDVDFEGMMSEAGTKAAEQFDLYIQHFGDKEEGFIPWNKVRTDFEAESKTINEAREFYHSQPLKLAIAEYLRTHDRKGDTPEAKLSSWLLWNNPEDMLIGQGTVEQRRERYITLARANSIMTFAVLKDGQWYERGSMGWWGCVSNEKDTFEWANQYLNLIENLPDDTLLTVVDCHI